jgi:hypothetical protein
MSTRRKPLEGQLPLPFMAEAEDIPDKPKLTIVRAEAEDIPDKPKPATKRRLPKAG